MIYLLVAIRAEFPEKLIPKKYKDKIKIIYMGIGVLNAYSTLSMLSLTSKDIIINLGSAGTNNKILLNQVVGCKIFFMEEYSVFSPYKLKLNSYSSNLPLRRIHFKFSHINFKFCYTYLKFSSKIKYEVIDMEAFGLAKYCNQNKLPFLSLKYISDSGKIKDWERQLDEGAKRLKKELVKLLKINNI